MLGHKRERLPYDVGVSVTGIFGEISAPFTCAALAGEEVEHVTRDVV